MEDYKARQIKVYRGNTCQSIEIVGELWANFIENDEIDTEIIPKAVCESWRRSKMNKVDPYLFKEAFLNENDLISYNKIVNTYGDELNNIQELAKDNGFSFIFFDKDGKTNQIYEIAKHIDYDYELSDVFGFDVSETSIGTNAVVLSLLDRQPKKFLGVYHYNKLAHLKANAVTALVCDVNKEVIGVFCILLEDCERIDDAYLTVISLAKLFEAEINLAYMKNQMKILSKRGKFGAVNRAEYTFDNIIGENKKLLEAKKTAMKVAKTSVPILIIGESGTGKELFAQSIHNASRRGEGPFVAINCGAIPSELVESELFGYEEGSFTGALKGGKTGKLEIATGGTFFLDEVESMPLNVQVKLLRALSTKSITRVGGTRSIPIDIRIISATKKDLLKEADNETFREDLYYRMSTFSVEIPALRDRIEDVPLLAVKFIKTFCNLYEIPDIKISDEFVRALSFYYWRGNIRELENVLERAVVLAMETGEINIDHLPEKIQKAYRYKSTKKLLKENKEENNIAKNLIKLGEEIIIESVLTETDFNIVKSCEILGISRKTLYNKINDNERLMRVKNTNDL